jgi:hypothetical protein
MAIKVLSLDIDKALIKVEDMLRTVPALVLSD